MSRKTGLPCWTARKYKTELDHDRHRAFQRARAQAHFRGHEWTMTYSDWQELWPEELWRQRGRGSDKLCFILIDPEKAYTRENVCVISRRNHLTIKNRRTHGRDVERILARAIHHLGPQP